MKRLISILAVIATPAFAQQQPQARQEAVTRALYERYQRADMEAIQLKAQVTTLEKEVADLKMAAEAAKPKEPDSK